MFFLFNGEGFIEVFMMDFFMISVQYFVVLNVVNQKMISIIYYIVYIKLSIIDNYYLNLTCYIDVCVSRLLFVIFKIEFKV